ncbi:MAG: TonB-dependent receptor [Janthinobacterium lividum]
MSGSMRRLLQKMTLLGATSLALPAMAQTAPPAQSEAPADLLGDIVVTATKTGNTALQRTPIAISAFDGAELRRSKVDNVRDLLELTPDVSVPQNSVFAQIYIRGVGSNNVFNGSDPSSTVQVDGVYYSRPYSQFSDFLDVDRVEVLRGPQGTIYGRNSIAGTINVISRRPTDDFSLRGDLLYGNYNAVQARGAVSGGVIPGLVDASIAMTYSRHDPWRQNVVASGDDIQNQNEYSVRAQVLVTPGAGIEATTRGDFSRDTSIPMGYAKILKPYDAVTNSILGDYSKIALDQVVRGNVKGSGVSEDIMIPLGSGVQLKSITAYRWASVDTANDTDSTDKNINLTLTGETQHQFSQEINLSGKTGRFTYVAGLYYFDEHVATDQIVYANVPKTYTGIFPVGTTSSRAVFAQGSYNLTDRLSLTAGLRYTDEKKIFDGDVGTFSQSTGLPTNPTTIYQGVGKYHALTPKFGIQYQATDAILFYASATRGYKSGGFNTTSRTAAAALGFKPETLWDYEAGMKSELLDRHLRLNLSVFHYDYQNLQVQAFISPGVTDISNAATAKIDGIEVETTILPVDHLRLQANFSYLNARYNKYPGASGPGGVVVDASGNELNAAPKYSGNAVAQYDFPFARGDNVSLRGEAFYQSRSFFIATNDPAQSQAPYALLNASLTYTTPKGDWDFGLYAKNLADRQYVTATATISPVVSGRPGDPRTFGLRASMRY